MKAIKGLHQNMINVTCLAQVLHCVADLVLNLYPNGNGLISLLKKIFLKAPSLVQKFLKIVRDIPFPPAPMYAAMKKTLKALRKHNIFVENKILEKT